MENKIIFRAIIEVLGKPQEHVEKTLVSYIEKLKKEEDFKVLNEKYAEIKKQEESEMWANFAEIEVETTELVKLTDFCFQYMPSMIEIIDPKEIKLTDREISEYLNDLQSKLHGVDMVAKTVKAENDNLKLNTAGLLKNYIVVLLRGREGLTGEQLAGLTGVKFDLLGDYLDQLIDEGKVDLKGDLYSLIE